MKKTELHQIIREEIGKALNEIETPGKYDSKYHSNILYKWDANPKFMKQDLIAMATDLMRRGMGEELEEMIEELKRTIPILLQKRNK